jgi:hypothetical protein
MTNIFRIILFILLLVPASEITAQKKITAADDVYGSDPRLYNGRLYTAFYRMNTENNQYLASSQFEPGTVTLRGVTYRDLLLNYDIYNQQLLLEYNSNPGFTSVIILSDAWLESFSIKDKKFRVFPVSDKENRIYQEIGSGQTRILYFWKKNLQFDNINGNSKWIFSNPVREMSLLTDGKTDKYRNNRSFVNLFSREKKREIREYIHSHRINVKKAGDEIMEQLIIFCNTLEEK